MEIVVNILCAASQGNAMGVSRRNNLDKMKRGGARCLQVAHLHKADLIAEVGQKEGVGETRNIPKRFNDEK